MPSSNSTRAAGALAPALLAASVWLACPAPAAAQAGPAPAEPVMWSEVEFGFEGTHVFPPEQLKKIVRGRLGRQFTRGDGTQTDLSKQPFDSDLLDYLLRMDVVSYMRSCGYLRAKIGEVRRERVGRALLITVPVEEGEFYRLGEVTIEGAEYFAADKLREFLPLRKGDVADGEVFVRWLSEHLSALYRDHGFIQYDYEVEPEYRLEPGATEGVSDLRITIREGRQFVISRIAFKGNRRTPEELLRPSLLVKEGEVYNARKFRETIDKINDLDYFERLDVEKDTEFRTDEETGDLELIVRVTERAVRPL